MQQILFDYKLNPTTWAYISALMMIGMYFKFHRFWSVRNLDLMLLISFSPAFLLIYYGISNQKMEQQQAGYVWLFIVSAMFLVRLLLDPVMVRRPLLEPNLSASGLTFTGVSLLIFLMANVITSPQERLENLMARQAEQTSTSPPGCALFYKFSHFSNQAMVSADPAKPEVYRQMQIRLAANRTAVILAHLAVVAGMVWIGFRHFGNIHTGVAAATLYLLTFYTSQFTSQVDHIVPGALLVWAAAVYRRPMIAGLFLGLAGGLIYYPFFLLPLWCGFYWRRGLVRFAFGTIVAILLLLGVLFLITPDAESFVAQVRQVFGWRNPLQVAPTGFWSFFEDLYRYPVLALFIAICGSLAIWPAQKNLGTLLSCSAAVMVAVQFWHANQGGLFMGWYLPLLILTVFRPNLEDRVALSAVPPLWRRKG